MENSAMGANVNPVKWAEPLRVESVRAGCTRPMRQPERSPSSPALASIWPASLRARRGWRRTAGQAAPPWPLRDPSRHDDRRPPYACRRRPSRSGMTSRATRGAGPTGRAGSKRLAPAERTGRTARKCRPVAGSRVPRGAHQPSTVPGSLRQHRSFEGAAPMVSPMAGRRDRPSTITRDSTTSMGLNDETGA